MAIADESLRSGLYWSPVLAGDIATIEFHAAADAPIDDVTLHIPRVSHSSSTGADLNSPPRRREGHRHRRRRQRARSTSRACAADARRVQNLAKAVAKLTFVGDDGRSYLCTRHAAQRLRAVDLPRTCITANHCLESARIARTLNTFWFYDAVACNSKATPAYVQLTGGAMLLGRSQDRDWSIVRLLDTPPAGAQFAAWRAEAVAGRHGHRHRSIIPRAISRRSARGVADGRSL